jgi:Secretion system C-terminal sorting domain/FG-GAP repeat
MLTVIDIERHYMNSADKVVPLSLSSDGSAVAIGGYYNDGNGSNAGHVRVYENIAGTWTQIGSDIDGEAASDNSGQSVSLNSDGNTVAIGAPNNNGNGSDAGHVRVYENIAGTWTQVGSDIDGEAAMDKSGYSVSLCSDGTIVAIGARDNSDNGTYAGQVRVYENILGTWTQVGSDIDGEATGDEFGHSVSISADGAIVAIGAPYNNGNGSGSGHVRVYKNNAGTWTQIGSDIDGEMTLDYSGYSSISSDGNTVAIGAQTNDGNGNSAGHTRIYSCNSFSSIVETTCVTYTSPSGKIWTTSGTYLDSIQNAMGCDSIITVNLTINNSNTGDTTAIVCDSMTWYGTTYYTSAMPTHTLTNVAGCDSVLTLNLTVNYANTGIDVQTACFSYLWIDGNTYTSNNNTATHTLSNAASCDSVVTLDLTINTVDVSVSQSSITLTATLSGASYQWVDCGNSYVVISGETNQSFTPTVNGDYAVIIDDGTCIDTSACYNINGVGINERIANLVQVYPNPTKGKITIECEGMEKVEVIDITGKIVYELTISTDVLDIDITTFSKGVYFVKVSSQDAVAVERIVLE